MTFLCAGAFKHIDDELEFLTNSGSAFTWKWRHKNEMVCKRAVPWKMSSSTIIKLFIRNTKKFQQYCAANPILCSGATITKHEKKLCNAYPFKMFGWGFSTTYPTWQKRIASHELMFWKEIQVYTSV